MKKGLDDRLQKDLFTEVVFFQLRSIDLPDPYEQALQNTEVTKQGILRAEAEKIKNNVTQEMRIEVAKIKREVIRNDAEGQSQAKKLVVDAQTFLFQQVQQYQAEAYAKLMTDLGLSKQELIQYL
jgi:ribosomal protein L7/L12